LNFESVRARKFSTVCGIVAPIFFTAMVIIESLLRPGYSQISNFISGLGVGQYALLQNINFWAFGIMVFTFALGIGQYLRSKAVAIGLSLFALMVFSAGLFPDAPSPYPGYVHGLVSIVAFISLIITEFLVGWKLRSFAMKKQIASWSKFKYYSFCTGIAGIIFIFLGNPPGYAGLFQRLFLGSGWLWIEIMALKLFLNLGFKMTALQSEGRVARERAEKI
jgi:hypothetical membrane protein